MTGLFVATFLPHSLHQQSRLYWINAIIIAVGLSPARCDLSAPIASPRDRSFYNTWGTASVAASGIAQLVVLSGVFCIHPLGIVTMASGRDYAIYCCCTFVWNIEGIPVSNPLPLSPRAYRHLQRSILWDGAAGRPRRHAGEQFGLRWGDTASWWHGQYVDGNLHLRPRHPEVRNVSDKYTSLGILCTRQTGVQSTILQLCFRPIYYCCNNPSACSFTGLSAFFALRVWRCSAILYACTLLVRMLDLYFHVHCE